MNSLSLFIAFESDEWCYFVVGIGSPALILFYCVCFVSVYFFFFFFLWILLPFGFEVSLSILKIKHWSYSYNNIHNILRLFYQIFLSPQVKRSAIISNKHSIYELPYELPNNSKLHRIIS